LKSRFALVVLPLVIAACSGTSESPPAVAAAPGVAPVASGERCAVELSRVVAYQSVAIPLGDGETSRNAELIAGKPALLRVFVAPTGAEPVEAQARLTIRSPAGIKTYDTHATVTAASADDTLSSTLGYDVPAADMLPGATASVELVTPACAGLPNARFPRVGEVELRPRRTGTLRTRSGSSSGTRCSPCTPWPTWS
jgi:hypothetical protein